MCVCMYVYIHTHTHICVCVYIYFFFFFFLLENEGTKLGHLDIVFTAKFYSQISRAKHTLLITLPSASSDADLR